MIPVTLVVFARIHFWGFLVIVQKETIPLRSVTMVSNLVVETCRPTCRPTCSTP